MADKQFTKRLAQHPLLQLIGNTPLVRVPVLEDDLPDVEVLAKCEHLNPGGSLKDRPVLRMLVEAIRDGILTKDKTILDSTSGNAGIAYAMIGQALGYRVELVMPDNASEERKKRIAAHGATIVYTPALKGYDEALREVRRRADERGDDYFFCDQYSNPNNWRSHYDTTAVEILKQTDGQMDCFVAGVGTGGTITGVGRRLKEHDARIQICAIIPEEFPGIEGLKPLGSPNDIVPDILDESVIDLRIPVSIEDAYEMCAKLARTGFFVGQSSGGYMCGVREVARQMRAGRIVTLFNDIGERYMSTRLWD